jgi:predicted alternative tryptophan synthase beta-subunit
MERSYNFKIYYKGEFVCSITAHTKWEAIDRAYYGKMEGDPGIDRQKITAR